VAAPRNTPADGGGVVIKGRARYGLIAKTPADGGGFCYQGFRASPKPC
jgi:hypothetical protein